MTFSTTLLAFYNIILYIIAIILLSSFTNNEVNCSVSSRPIISNDFSQISYLKVAQNLEQALPSSLLINNKIDADYNDVKKIGKNDADRRQRRWSRIKRNIPVLEPVRHLLNGIREGTINHTSSILFPNRLFGNKSINGNSLSTKMQTNTTSAAIETEEEREMVTHGSDLQILELLAAAGNKLWTFFSGLRDAILTGVVNASSGSSAFG